MAAEAFCLFTDDEVCGKTIIITGITAAFLRAEFFSLIV